MNYSNIFLEDFTKEIEDNDTFFQQQELLLLKNINEEMDNETKKHPESYLKGLLQNLSYLQDTSNLFFVSSLKRFATTRLIATVENTNQYV